MGGSFLSFRVLISFGGWYNGGEGGDDGEEMVGWSASDGVAIYYGKKKLD